MKEEKKRVRVHFCNPFVVCASCRAGKYNADVCLRGFTKPKKSVEMSRQRFSVLFWSSGVVGKSFCSNQVAFHLSLYICDVHLNTSTQCGISKRELFSQRYGCTAWRSRCSAQTHLQHAPSLPQSPLVVIYKTQVFNFFDKLRLGGFPGAQV